MTVHEITGIPVRLTAPCVYNAVGPVRRISVPRWWVALCLAAAFSTSASAADQDAWTIRILPATKLVALAQAAPTQPVPAPTPQEPGAKPEPKSNAPVPRAALPQGHSGELRIIPGHPHSTAASKRPSYADVYRSIPFSWAEYAANPSYRSQAALGLMLNQMPYPSASQSAVPQYGYVTPYLFDNTYGTPSSTSTLYTLPLGGW